MRGERAVIGQKLATVGITLNKAIVKTISEQIILSFSIDAKGKDTLKSTYLKEVTKLFTNDVKTLGVSNL